MISAIRFFCYAPLFFCLIALALSSCKKEIPLNVSEEDIADLVTYALQQETAGTIQEALSAVSLEDIYAALDQHCDESIDSSVHYTYQQNNITADYQREMDWLIECNILNVPQYVLFTSTSTGQYSTLRLSSTDTANNEFSVSGLEWGSDHYLINGITSRVGTQESLIRDRDYSSTCLLTLSQLAIAKADDHIASGTAAVTVTGQQSNGAEFTFDGSLVFNGDDTATLTLNGQVFEIAW